ncbi:hypothetical protein AYO44_05990 [Planctomycetaceae bacterium SCGC AG-212-F19]|nr:hypothetical protein AYO44_05990 [Planctomycetaceae bacterium SCGC AG-212-F19]
MVFARKISGPLTGLVKQLDEATAKYKKAKLGTFVVFLSDDAGTAEKVIALAEQQKVEHTSLAIAEGEGPEGYHVSADAEVTVVLYTGRVAKANYAFKEGKMTAEDVKRIVGDIAKIVPGK